MKIEEIKKQIYEIENQYLNLHIDLHRDQFKIDDLNKLLKLYKKLNKKEGE